MSSASLFEANLAALALDSGSEELVELLRRTEPADGLELVQTPSGNPTCRSGGVWVYSRHDPSREARRLVERELPKTTEVCVFENFGLGYHVEAFLDHCETGRAVVVEPDIGWFRSALESRDLTALFASKRTQFLIDSPSGLLQTVLGDARDVQLLRMRPLAGKDSTYFEQVSDEIRVFSARKDINSNTLARFGHRWVRNLIRNIRLLPEARGVNELAGAFRGIPALLLAAGPSLNEILPEIRRLRERFLIVAVDTSYRAAIAAGVTPDFLVIVDPQYWNARHLDGHSLESTILVSESSTYPGVFHRGLGPLFFCGSLFPLGQYLERATGEKGKLGAGGSVSTTTWDFARTLGCSPLLCAGLDLGFPRLGTHFHGGFFEERMHTISNRTSTAASMSYHLLRDASPYPVENNTGGTTLTDRRLVIYKWWFEGQLKIYPSTNTLNLSKSGVKIEGMPYEEPAGLLDYPPIRGEIDKRIGRIRAEAIEKKRQSDVRIKVKAALAELTDELKHLAEEASSALETLDRLERQLQRDGDPTERLNELNDIDGRISSLMSRDIAGFLMHSTAQTILERGGGAQTPGEQPLHDSRELYTKLYDAADYHLRLLERGRNWF